MSRFWSPVVHDLTPYVPGEQPKLANLVKLNTNENPYPPSPRVVEALQREIGAEREARRHADDGKGQDIARPEQHRPAERQHGQPHRRQPGGHAADFGGETHPAGQRRRPGDEVQREQRPARRLGLQDVGHEKQEQRRWQR